MKIAALALAAFTPLVSAVHTLQCYGADPMPGTPPAPSHISDCSYAHTELVMNLTSTGSTLHFARQHNLPEALIQLPFVTKLNAFGGPLGCQLLVDFKNGYRAAELQTGELTDASVALFAQCARPSTQEGQEARMLAGEAIVGQERRIMIRVSGVEMPPSIPDEGDQSIQEITR